VKEWFKEGVRCMVFFYKTNCFSGTLQSSEEGEVFWAPADKISEYPLANDFENNLELFYSEEISELFYGADEERILKKY
jgi:8-oxo-dGTP diphosphatase